MTEAPATIEFKTLDQLTAREAYELFKLRVDVFVAEQSTPFAELDETDAEADTYHILARAVAPSGGAGPAGRGTLPATGELIGCGRVFPTPQGPRFGRFVVAPAARGTGAGPALLTEAIEFSRRWPGDLLIDAQAGLTGYYQRFGFVPEGEEFLDTGVPHVAMRLQRERR